METKVCELIFVGIEILERQLDLVNDAVEGAFQLIPGYSRAVIYSFG